MSDAGTATAGTATTDAATAAAANGAATAWYSGMEAEDIGWLQNRGLAEPDPAKAAPNLARQFRNLEALRGVPADQIFRWPNPDEDQAPLLRKWGVPEDPANYNFDGISYEIEREAADPLYASARTMAAKNKLNNEQLVGVVDWLLENLEANRNGETETKTRLMSEAEERLRKSWGANFADNEQIANNGFERIALLMQAAGETEQLQRTQGALDALRESGHGDWARALLRVIGRGFQDRAGNMASSGPGPAQTREEAVYKLKAYRDLGTPQGQAYARRDPQAEAEVNELIRLSHAGEPGW